VEKLKNFGTGGERKKSNACEMRIRNCKKMRDHFNQRKKEDSKNSGSNNKLVRGGKGGRIRSREQASFK